MMRFRGNVSATRWAARSPRVWSGNRRGRRSAESRQLSTPTVPLLRGRVPSVLPQRQSRRSERRSCDNCRMARKVSERSICTFKMPRRCRNTFSSSDSDTMLGNSGSVINPAVALVGPNGSSSSPPLPVSNHQDTNPHAIPRRHAPVEALARQGSFRGFPALSQKTSPFKRQMSLRMNELPSTMQRKSDFPMKNTGELLRS